VTVGSGRDLDQASGLVVPDSVVDEVGHEASQQHPAAEDLRFARAFSHDQTQPRDRSGLVIEGRRDEFGE
jgi:hypothetical protein